MVEETLTETLVTEYSKSSDISTQDVSTIPEEITNTITTGILPPSKTTINLSTTTIYMIESSSANSIRTIVSETSQAYFTDSDSPVPTDIVVGSASTLTISLAAFLAIFLF